MEMRAGSIYSFINEGSVNMRDDYSMIITCLPAALAPLESLGSLESSGSLSAGSTVISGIAGGHEAPRASGTDAGCAPLAAR